MHVHCGGYLGTKRLNNQSINQSNFYSANIPGVARLSVATARSVFSGVVGTRSMYIMFSTLQVTSLELSQGHNQGQNAHPCHVGCLGAKGDHHSSGGL